MSARPDSATLFNALHRGPGILKLANAWDAGSARLFESLGAQAIATTSAGFAWALGFPDGNALPLEHLVSHVALIARTVTVPLSVDMEAGFGRDAAEVGRAVSQIIDVGGIGINIEDGSNPPEQLAARIAAARAAGDGSGVDLYINARTDVYLRGLVPAEARVGETLKRARIYREAGASGIFVPGVVAADEIRAIAAGTDMPLNVLAWAGLPGAAELGKLGVRRLSAGSGIAEAVWGRAGALAKAFLADGESAPLSEGAMGYGAINAIAKIN
ncbi:isocitrate lyase/phosphoenolpyruvate mutase family protein [Dongia sp.]|uniref:isocitrate lyase/PEP mutase family protein n=1 Tax=Dongia sp. TaxID=1977262 RepID=UPI0035B27477